MEMQVADPVPIGSVPVYSPVKTYLKIDGRLPAQQLAGQRGVGPRAFQVRGLSLMVNQSGPGTQTLGQLVDEQLQGDHFAPAQVDDLVAEGPQGQNGTLDNIIDKSKIAGLTAVAVDVQRLIGGQPVNEAQNRHVGATCRPVDREIAQYTHIDAVVVVVSVGQQFGGPFGGGVG